MTHLKAKALAAMRRIARATTPEDFDRQVEALKADEELWSQSLFRKWFEKTWLRQHKVKTFCLRSSMYLVSPIIPLLRHITL